MSTLTYKSLALIMILGGCQATDILTTSAIEPAQNDTPPRSTVLSNGLIVSAPDSYCIDTVSSQRLGWHRTGVIIASCARVKNPKADDPTDARLFTASPIEDPLPATTDIKPFFDTDAGKASLAASGKAGDVTIHRIKTSRHAVYIDMTDASRPKHMNQRSWRAVLRVKNAGFILGTYAGKGSGVAGHVGETAIRDFAAKILRTNS